MTCRHRPFVPFTLALLAIAALPCASAAPADVAALPAGRFDNAAQAGQAVPGSDHPIPHVTLTIEPTPKKDFALWHVHIETGPDAKYDQTWAIQTRIEHDGSVALVPYYQLHQDSTPDAATFDTPGWLSLEACALRGDPGKAPFHAMSEGEPCVAASMNVGARRALLPVGVERDGNALELDMNLFNTRMRIDAKRDAAR
jgi:hypothetical protein